MPLPRRLLLLAVTLAALGLVTAACGDDADTPPAAGACLEGTADCNDTPGDIDVPVPEPGDLGMLPDDTGLTPEDALSLGPDDGAVPVRGFLLADETGTYLCGALAESFPPQCGGGALLLDGFDLEAVDAPLVSEQATTWTDETVMVVGTIDNGVLTPTTGG